MSSAERQQQQPLLIVEDDLALQKQLKWSLDRFESVVADDVASAVLQFRRHGPAVVTMDLGLPPDADSVSEGFKCLEKLLELDPNAKVIVLTGQNDQDNALRAIRMGAYDFLAKPVDPDVLALTVERAYRLYELQQENHRLQTLQRHWDRSSVVERHIGLRARTLAEHGHLRRVCDATGRVSAHRDGSVSGHDTAVLEAEEAAYAREDISEEAADPAAAARLHLPRRYAVLAGAE